jgi:hypothetical protein
MQLQVAVDRQLLYLHDSHPGGVVGGHSHANRLDRVLEQCRILSSLNQATESIRNMPQSAMKHGWGSVGGHSQDTSKGGNSGIAYLLMEHHLGLQAFRPVELIGCRLNKPVHNAV